ncbi:MAG: AAA family ATPase [Oscillospiraceae bacterium]|nr:AAA family ATPase [Oscillospiraceae bacterium]
MKIIIINGPMGVGKTTVGKYIADKNEGTAFIDGDWCFDIHPFIGNKETKSMAIDNILHMIGNYRKCSACRMIVLVWLMDDHWVYDRIMKGLADLHMEIRSVTLICDKINLIKRWKNDSVCEWRTDEWLDVSVDSISGFSAFDDPIDTSDLSVEEIAEMILKRD